MGYQSYFKCSQCCDEKYPLDEVIYNCRKCGGLLEVEHDIEQLKQKTGQEWKDLFLKRTKTNDYPYGSGVWGKKEWVLPNIDDENSDSAESRQCLSGCDREPAQQLQPLGR